MTATIPFWSAPRRCKSYIIQAITQAMRRHIPLLVVPLLLLTIKGQAISAFTYRDISEKASREKSPYTTLTHASGDDDVPLSLPTLLWSKRSSRSGSSILNRRYCCLVLQASSSSGGSNNSDKGKNDGGGKKGYRFGDITKSLIGGSVERVRVFYRRDFIVRSNLSYSSVCRL